MATTVNLAEAGWFYHAPAKRNPNAEPVPVPPMSQIPCLNGVPDEPDDHKQMYFKSTDSDYIRLAKMGGRPDLLRQRTPKPKSDKPKPYPRVDWFYQDDILMSNAENQAESKEPYKFMLPNYMVHRGQEHGETKKAVENGGWTCAQRPPYGHDSATAFTGGREAADKTVKLPEIRKEGYGVRQERATKAASKKSRGPVQGFVDCSDPATAKKLLQSQSRDREQYGGLSRKKDSTKKGPPPAPMEKMITEYQEKICGVGGPVRRVPAVKKSPSKQDTIKRHEDVEEKELFKLSKFKNVQSRTDCHRQFE